MGKRSKSTDIFDAYEQVEYEDLNEPEIGVSDDWESGVDDLITDDPVQVNQHITRSSGQRQLGFTDKSPKRSYCGGHDGDAHLFSIEYEEEGGRTFTKSISGASGAHLNPTHTALVIDCAGLYSSGTSTKPFIEGDERFDSLKQFVVDPPILRLHWTDMGIPPVQYDFWVELMDLLPEGLTKICCHGGHGRTGTALAALYLVAHPDVTADDAIDLVRKEHCSRAIETAGQEDYLRNLARERDALAA